MTYNNFGDITKLPASDAGGAELQSTYYIDGQLDEQKQGEQTIGPWLIYKWSITSKTRWIAGTGMILGFTIIGTVSGLSWRDAVVLGAIIALVSLIVVDAYIRGRNAG